MWNRMSTTSRLSAVDQEAFTSEERELYKSVTAGPHNPTGPTAIWSRSPHLARAALDFGNYIRFHSVLDPRVRELAVLVTAAEWHSENEWRAHERLGVAAGLDRKVIHSIRGEFSSPDAVERAVHAFVTSLHREGDVPDDVYAAAADLLGDRGVVELVSTVGFYTMIAMLLNSTRAPLTSPAEPTEPGPRT
jgi:4-carboxymuconolactone decarboxylase